MLIIGIITGLLMAFFQSCSYLASRFFYAKTAGSGFHLLSLAHIQMGIAAAILLWIFWPQQPLPFSTVALIVILNSLVYMAGQAFFLLALKHANPSQIASLLALKLIVISAASSVILHLEISALQVIGIILSLIAVVLLNSSRDKIPIKGFILSLFAVAGYSASDICIVVIVNDLNNYGIPNASFIATCLVYICTGVIGMMILPFLKNSWKRPVMWLSALPFAGSWLTAMFFLFQTFLLLGPVFGNILQTTRGIISVLLGLLVTRLGFFHLEEKMLRHAFIRRLGTALLMTGAVSLFVISIT
jgi:drug/metabolite transporter (DMT)-like permease